MTNGSKYMNKYWVPLFAALSLCGCAAGESKPPVEVSVQEAEDIYSRQVSEIVIRAVADSVKIEKVTVNRGNNCGLGATDWHNLWPGSGILKFGQSVSGRTVCSMDSIKEVDVETDTDTYTFNF